MNYKVFPDKWRVDNRIYLAVCDDDQTMQLTASLPPHEALMMAFDIIKTAYGMDPTLIPGRENDQRQLTEPPSHPDIARAQADVDRILRGY